MKTVEAISIIEQKAKAYADARSVLSERVTHMRDELRTIERRHLPGIKLAAAKAKDAQAVLSAAIQKSPECFVKPRSVTFHGVKVGFQKGKGRIEWEDTDQVVALIKKHLPDQAEVLIATKEVPIKKALENLSVSDLRKIGCTVEEAGDSVYIKADDSELEKIVAGILAEGAIEEAS